MLSGLVIVEVCVGQTRPRQPQVWHWPAWSRVVADQAESFRSELLSAMRKGEAFDIDAGQPVSMLRREDRATSWFDFAGSYVDMKWPRAAGKYRKSIAEALTSATIAILENGPIGLMPSLSARRCSITPSTRTVERPSHRTR